MVTVRSVETSREISSGDLKEIHQDIKRMIRRARGVKQSRVFLHESLERFMEFLRTFQAFYADMELEELWSLLNNNHEECLDAIGPFRSFFYSHGLLPDDVSDDALLAYVIQEAKNRGLLDVT